MKRTSLLQKIRLMFAAVLLVLGVTMGLVLWGLSRSAVSTQIQKDVGLASDYLKTYISQTRSELKLQAKLVAEQPSLRAILADPMLSTDQATLDDRLEFYRKSVSADGLAFYNFEGLRRSHLGITPTNKTLLKGARIGLINESFENWDGFEEHRDGFLLSTCVPVKIGQQIIGFIQAYRLVGDNATAQLAKSLGIQVAFQLRGKVVAASMDGLDSIPSSLDTYSVQVNGQTYGGSHLNVRDTMTGQGISVAILRSEQDATAAYRRLMKILAIFVPLAMLAAALVAGHFAKGLTSNLASVVFAAKELSAGRWPGRLEVKTQDEVGLLQEVFNDTVDSLQSAQARLMAMIDIDPMTELHNHRHFMDTLGHEVARTRDSNEELGFIQIDIDNFKQFNENRGLVEGDEVLKSIARILEVNTGAYAHRARFAGEEFAILLPRSNDDHTMEVAENIRLAINEAGLGVTVSIGCAQFGINTNRPEGLTIAAELALARAKQLGRDRICRFDSVPGADSEADPYQLHKYMQDASLATIQALAAAVDAKDAYTKGHSMRVAEYATALAKFIGCSQEIQDLTYRTGTLHDVGKIGVPDSILKKPSRMDDDERAIMETHPVLGELIVRKAPQLEDTIPGVRNHHEMWNGNGYPDKLAGENIPFIARLLAVADTYDAMTSDRPYRKGLAVEIALSEIEKGAGSQFDPKLAIAFVEMMAPQEMQMAA